MIPIPHLLAWTTTPWTLDFQFGHHGWALKSNMSKSNDETPVNNITFLAKARLPDILQR